MRPSLPDWLAQVLSQPLTSIAPSELYDAAQSRQSPQVNLLRLLAGAPDLGAPGEDVLDGTFSSLEYLAADAERLYAAAEKGGRGVGSVMRSVSRWWWVALRFISVL